MPTFSMAETRRLVRLPLGIGGVDGTDQSKFDNNKIDLFTNLSYQALLARYNFREKEITATVTTTAGKRNYQMPDPHDALRHISIQHPETLDWTPLDRMSVDDYVGRWSSEDDERGFPTHYVRESCLYRLWPTPDAVYTLTVRYWGVLADLVEGSTSIEIPNIWWEPIYIGGSVRAAIALGMVEKAEWLSRYQKSLIDDIISIEEKEEEDSHRSGLQVLGREY